MGHQAVGKSCQFHAREFPRRSLSNTKGTAALEFALLAPMMILLLTGTVEVSQALTVDRRVTQIASSAADLVARERSMTTPDVASTMQIAEHLIRPFDPSRLRITIVNVIADIGDAANTRVCWSYNHNGGTRIYTDGQSYPLPAGIIEAGNSVVVAEVTYNYQPQIFSYAAASAFPLSERFYLKPRQSSYVEYNATKCS